MVALENNGDLLVEFVELPYLYVLVCKQYHQGQSLFLNVYILFFPCKYFFFPESIDGGILSLIPNLVSILRYHFSGNCFIINI